ncbi:MAG: prepilin-type N-terminal cleavage/methylation domain-containing protein [Proteobacteria bacterium]|nr:prepilin-type N-terminal cleavage/methylation domain-containing protein [Pseudomonadota bacterium]MBU1686290.1 prepilin-type N-terminal cleavage/methylation domain-containing protein [Pseudomonadota bacterium]
MKTISKIKLTNRPGYSLIEVMVVLCIVGIMAASAGYYLNTTETEMKGFAFTTRAYFVQARNEAIKRGYPVYLDFDFDGDEDADPNDTDKCIDNGYTIWVDQNKDEVYKTVDGDAILLTVNLENMESPPPNNKKGPEVYFTKFPTGCSGSFTPPTGPPGDDGPGTKTIKDGVNMSGSDAIQRFKFNPDGTSDNGSAYFYLPEGPRSAKEVGEGPWTVIVNNVGRISLDNYGLSLDPADGVVKNKWRVNQ